jgi:hypothetical protein
MLDDWAFMWTKLTVVMTPPGGAQSLTRAGHTLTFLKNKAANGCLRVMPICWLLCRNDTQQGAPDGLALFRYGVTSRFCD